MIKFMKKHPKAVLLVIVCILKLMIALPHLVDSAKWLMESQPDKCATLAFPSDYFVLVAMGVLDPTKVTRCALQNAASVAGLMLTTDAMVAELPKEEKGMAGGMGGGMGGMGGMDM